MGVAERRTPSDRIGILNGRAIRAAQDSDPIRRRQPAGCAGRPSNRSSLFLRSSVSPRLIRFSVASIPSRSRDTEKEIRGRRARRACEPGLASDRAGVRGRPPV